MLITHEIAIWINNTYDNDLETKNDFLQNIGQILFVVLVTISHSNINQFVLLTERFYQNCQAVLAL